MSIKFSVFDESKYKLIIPYVKSWSQIDALLKQRFEMIPNLVEVVKGYSNYEKNTLEAVVNARNRCLIINKVLEKYGGGGHIYASGARLTNKDDVEKLIKDLEELCKEYK